METPNRLPADHPIWQQIARQDAAIAAWNKAQRKADFAMEMKQAECLASGFSREDALSAAIIEMRHGRAAREAAAAWEKVQKVFGCNDPIGF